MTNMITGIISITIGAVILSSVFMTTIKGFNTSGVCIANSSSDFDCATMENTTIIGAWSPAEVAMWGLLSLIGVVGLLYGVLNVFGLV